MDCSSSGQFWGKGPKIVWLETTGTASGQKRNGQVQVKEAQSEKIGIDIKHNHV